MQTYTESFTGQPTGYMDSYGNPINDGDLLSVVMVIPNRGVYAEAKSYVKFNEATREYYISLSTVYSDLRKITSLKLTGSEDYTILNLGQRRLEEGDES